MSDYAQLVFYGPKDVLATGNPLKLIRGTEIDAELAAISTAIATKADLSGDSILFADGTVGAPSISFAADPDTGIYRIGANNYGFSASGVLQFEVSAAGLLLKDGNAAAPSLTFSLDANTGIYRGGVDLLAFATAGVARWQINASGHLEALGTFQILHSGGSAALPAYSFVGDPDTGFNLASANTIGINTSGARVAFWDTAGLNFEAGKFIFATAGSAAAPSYTFGGDPDTGIFLRVANEVTIAAGGSEVMSFGATTNSALISLRRSAGDKAYINIATAADSIITGSVVDDLLFRTVVPTSMLFSVDNGSSAALKLVATSGQAQFKDGSAGTPSISFGGDPDTGIYRVGANQFAFVSGGTGVADVVSLTTGGLRVMDYGGTLQVVGFREIPQNAQAGNYTLLVGDSGKHIYHASGDGAGDTYTIPANSSVAYPLGTVLTFVNDDSNAVSIAITTDTMTLAGTTTTGTRTLGENGIATAIKVTSTSWIISGTGLS